ncbi:MAG: alpha-galactosidase [Kiritimatiellae bacterium]|nr:alpha-galactosidase [Kiritimatiellia bacterium]
MRKAIVPIMALAAASAMADEQAQLLLVGAGVVASEPSVRKGVVASRGDVEVVCSRSDGWRFAMRETRVEDGVCELELELSRDEPAEPPVFRIEVVSPVTDMEYRWTPVFGCPGRIPQPEWTTWYAVQRTLPLVQRMNGASRNRVLVAIDEIRKDIVADCGIDENDFTVRDRFSFFDGVRDPAARYAVRIRVDRRDVACSLAVAEAARWISSSAGAPPPLKAPAAAFKPLYSTWYAHHLDIGAEKIERELALASSLGMETVIIDAGWSIEGETADWMAACGDWRAARGRFPDMAGHVRRVHALGMKCMLWCAVPFVGRQSEARQHFAGKFLYEFGANKTAVLDPRFPEVRERLARTCETMVREWGLDGMKLDFIDQIETRGRVDPAVADGFAGRDCRTVAEGVERLMTEIRRRLVAVRPDVMIEFRLAYFGPVMQSCGNMMRVADCPGQQAANRVGTVNLRLLCPESAVHADMIKWNAGDSPEEAARYILSSIFGVVQYSVVLETLPKAHLAMLRHWIDFTRRHESALLHGDLAPCHPERDYPVVVGSDAHEHIVLVSGIGEVADIPMDCRTIVLNNTGAGELLLRTGAAAVAEIFDTYGTHVGTREVERGLNALDVPISGYVQLVRQME